MRGSSLLWIGLLVLAVCMLPSSGSAERQRDRGGGNEIYLPDRQMVQFDCSHQCATFRQACVDFCKDSGHVPGGSEESDDCAKDCKQMEEDCLTTCIRGMSFSEPPPAMRR